MWDRKNTQENTLWPQQRQLYSLTLFATLLTLIVVILGAYTRLTDAGLGCPDWPGCYGQIIPNSVPGLDNRDSQKAWTEMLHRYMAGLLGLVILAINVFSIRNQRFSNQPLVLPLCLVALVIFQAALGMWTVTLKLYPLVVVAHLLGGLTSLSLVWCLSLKLKPSRIPKIPLSPTSTKLEKLKSLRIIAALALTVLIIQLFLGGWTSANYAALVCLDFPHCQAGQFFPGPSTQLLHFLSAFNLVTAGVTEGFGSPLDIHARIIIHMMHRLWAVITTIVIGGVAIQIFRFLPSRFFKQLSLFIIILLVIQLMLGITNVLAILPLPIAISHHAVAALLLLALVTLNYTLFSPSCSQHRI